MFIRSVCVVAIAFCLIDGVFCGVTMADMKKSTDMVRNVCQPKFKVSDPDVDGLSNGVFPEIKDLKCYTHCVLEMMGMMKKAKINYAAAMKQIDVMLPDDMKDLYKASLTACKDSTNGMKDACEAGYTLLKCVKNNNPRFVFT